MSVVELAAKYKVRRKLIRKMMAGGDISREPKGDIAASIRAQLSSGQQLTVQQLLALLKNPQLFRELGAYVDSAQDQVWELGGVADGAAPSHVSENLSGAADGDPESVEIVMRWLKATLPRGAVRYHWVATRLLIIHRPILARADFVCAWKALENVREHPSFSKWWSKKPVGAQNPIFYHRPIIHYDL